MPDPISMPLLLREALTEISVQAIDERWHWLDGWDEAPGPRQLHYARAALGRPGWLFPLCRPFLMPQEFSQ